MPDSVKPIVARQPIFDRARQVLAYELLYRGSGDADAAEATARVMIESLEQIDLDVLAPGTRLFVNMPLVAFGWSLAQMLPADRFVLEVLEDIPPDAALMTAIERQRADGFRIALDDFVWTPAHEPLIGLADFVKLDILALGDQLAATVGRCRRPGVQMIAEKVETAEQLDACDALGFDAFQGYVFCQPTSGGRGPMPSPSVVLVELVAKLRDPEVSTTDLAALLRRDATLAYQILRLANSPLNGVRRQVRSIEDALVVLGSDAVRNWAAILVLARLSSKRPTALLELAVTRGAMCARTGELLGLRDGDTLYTIGLLSVLDGLLNRPMQGILAGLSLAEPVRDALLGGSGPLGDVLRLVIEFERGQWHALKDDVTELMMSSLSDAYESALSDSRAMLAITE